MSITINHLLLAGYKQLYGCYGFDLPSWALESDRQKYLVGASMRSDWLLNLKLSRALNHLA